MKEVPPELEQKAREMVAKLTENPGWRAQIVYEAMLAALQHAVDEQKRLAPDLVRDAMLWRENAQHAPPREPTPAMIQEAIVRCVNKENGGLEWAIAEAWRAMYDAHQKEQKCE